LPSCQKSGGGTESEHDGQFNEAFSIGGPSCTVLAVQKLTGIKINHYVQVDFTGFKTMVDALHGVSICSTVPLRDDESGLRLPAGTTVLKGEQALAFVRARYGIGDGSDLGRIQRQQRFLGSMVRSATSSKLLLNPVALTKFLDAATKSLTLDRATSFGDLKALASQLHGLDPKKVSFLTAPIADPAYTPPGFPAPPPGQGGSRVLLDDVAGRSLYDSIINDKPQPPKTPAKPSSSPQPNRLTVAPQEVSVRVLNGVGMTGLGRKVSGDLQSVGFETVEPSNAPPTATTTVRYGPKNKEQATTLAAAVPGGVLQADASTDLDLVVGSNYTGVKTVKIGDPATGTAAPAPKPAAATTPTPATTPAVTAADARCG
jgi:LCP family protein required for cell wall assembly